MPNLQAHREKLKLNYRARGRPRLPKYLLEGLTVASVHDESSSEEIGTNSPFAMKLITSGRNLGSDLLKGSRWIVDLPYLFPELRKARDSPHVSFFFVFHFRSLIYCYQNY